jgi:Mg2+-importing ATPase
MILRADTSSTPHYKEKEAKGVSYLLETFETSFKGLSEKECIRRLEEYGFNEPAKRKKHAVVLQLLSKFLNPMVIVLFIIATSSFFFGEAIGGMIVIAMALVSVSMSFFQEYKAGREAEKLSEMVRANATVLRDGKMKDIPIRDVVPGDIIDLTAGDIVPADLRIIQAKDLFVQQSNITGESMPVEKSPCNCIIKNFESDNPTSAAFMGSTIVSGTGLAVVVRTGVNTIYGQISKRAAHITVQTNFDRGIKQFMWMMIYTMLVMVVFICAINFFMKGNFIEALLFSLAVAVGITPEMLPVIIAITLSKGAMAMSKKQVIVKKLTSIQNFGAIDVLCTDKTGTLTLDKIVLEKFCDVKGEEDKEVLKYAYINSYYQTGLKNILDKAVLKYEKISLQGLQKIDEVPFDFSRRMMSVVVHMDNEHVIVTKGAPREIISRCTQYELNGELRSLANGVLSELLQEYENLSREGFRVLAVAYKKNSAFKEVYTKEDERDLILKGYVAFLDPPKPSTKKVIDQLKNLGISLVVLTGDNELVTQKICKEVGLPIKGLILGPNIESTSDEELRAIVNNNNVFARVSPLQKERILIAIQQNSHTVGFLGDGINDIAALKAADVGISVDNAADIAKESADIILLQKSLMVLREGILEGRKTFGNILKYIKMVSSSNFGNMFSMTGASILLPFLPMLPMQILLNNFLYDFSQIAIPSDDVDEDYLVAPKAWNINYIRNFMIIFGCISSVFDFITFGILFYIFKASESLFQTAWFLESLCTQTLVIHIIRTWKIPFLESMPSQLLMFASVYIVTIGLLLPFTPIGLHLGFVDVPSTFFAALSIIVAMYLYSVNLAKGWFIRKFGYE